jgi:cell division protein FtsB
MENMRREQEMGMAQLKDGYNAELAKARSELEQKLKDARSNDASEFVKVRNELSERIHERNEELKVMRSLMETDHRNLDNLVKENDALKAELKQKSDGLERARMEAAVRDEELKLLRKSHETCVELKDALRKEEVEKVQLGQSLILCQVLF